VAGPQVFQISSGVAKVTAVELPGLRRVAYGVVLAQTVVTALLAGLCYIPWGARASLSAAIGGGIAVIAGLTLVLVVFRGGRSLPELVRAFYIGEAAKIGVMVVLFAVVLATMKKMVVPGALFGAFAATFLVQSIVLPRAMRRLDSGQLGG
jgi:F0F1-type ATP synthase assembly protein I